MIQPSPSIDREVHQHHHHPAPSRVLYEIVASGDLPCFDPLLTIKQCLLSPRQIRAFNHVIHATRYVLFPMYLAGFLLRFAVIFSPVGMGRLLGPITLGFQFWIAFQVIFAFRVKFAKVLIGTFEFWFMLLNSTTWMVCFALYLRDPRALLLPSCWVDFADMLLIETYFQNTLNVAIVASASACFLLSLSIGVSLDAIEEGRHIAIAQVNSHVLSTKDILVNTMATMITLLVRLSYRKYEVLRHQKRKETTASSVSWTQSSGYRCRIELRPTSATQARTDPGYHASLSSASASPPTAPSSIGYENPDGCKKLLHMQFVRVPVFLDSECTIWPRISRFTARIRKWQLGLLYCTGLIGVALTPIALHPSTHTIYPEAVSVVAITGVCASVAFWLPFICCAQRQLVFKLWTSFDFLFVYAQLVTAHVALCDMLSWQWIYCCAVLSSFLWMQSVLTIDTVTPVMRSHLGWRSWFIVPVVASFMLMQALLLQAVLQWNHRDFHNRLLFDSSIGSGYQLEFYVVLFFLNRQFTLFVWCVRILYRFRTRKSESELLLLLGNVEFNYAHWKQSRRQQQEEESLLQPFSS